MILFRAIGEKDTELLINSRSGAECLRGSTPHHCGATQIYSPLLSWLAKIIAGDLVL